MSVGAFACKMAENFMKQSFRNLTLTEFEAEASNHVGLLLKGRA